MDTIAEELNTPKRRGRPPKNKTDTVIQSNADTVKEKISYNDLSEPQKRVYDIVSIFRKLDAAQAIIEYKIRGFTIDEIERALQNPIQNYQTIIDICWSFYNQYGFFRELIDLYIKPPYFRYTVNLDVTGVAFNKSKNNEKRMEKDFIEYLSEFKRLNFEREFKRVLLRAHIEDAVCAYILKEGDAREFFYFPLSWVKIDSKIHGNWAYKLNTPRIMDRDIEKLPKEIASLVRRHKKKQGDEAFAPIPFDKMFCVKYSDYTNQILPPYLYLIQLVVDLLKAKQLGLLRDEDDVTTLISMLIPHNPNEHDDILFTDPIIQKFANGINDLVGDGKAVLPSPFNLDVLPTSKSVTSEKDTVKNTLKNINNESNFPDFTGTTGTHMSKAVQFSETKVFSLMEQIQSVLNSIMKFSDYFGYSGYEFNLEILRITRFNEVEVQDAILKQCQTGALAKFKREAAMGNPPDRVIGMSFLENTLFSNVFSNLTVLPTSYTQSGSGGRPQLDDGSLTDSGGQSRDNGNNLPENRDV